mmetsp:Transcript_72028/g.154183  ORF Transcript_72028/g.154183 Transcript_72028/m.154183 type:complete len:383 (+) Transcript_72028:88-1236(+)
MLASQAGNGGQGSKSAPTALMAALVSAILFVLLVVVIIFEILTYNHIDDITPSCPVQTQTPTYPPELPGVLPGDKPKLLVGMDVDWPPYAFVDDFPLGNGTLDGIGHDILYAMGAMCNIDVHVMQTSWGNCWGSSKIGAGLQGGYFHACTTYTHTIGLRPRYMEFSDPILQHNKPAGLITLLNSGVPIVSPNDNLSGKKVADVTGWAPTADTLIASMNDCTGQRFTNFTMVESSSTNPNDDAMQKLRDGTVDAIWVYADQAYNYDCSKPGVTPTWSCPLWNGFGTDYAYIHTGIFEHTHNGTTLTMAKMGSGVKQLVDPCLKSFMQTEEYYTICVKHGLNGSCFPNSYFPTTSSSTKIWEYATNEIPSGQGGCANGYCKCTR